MNRHINLCSTTLVSFCEPCYYVTSNSSSGFEISDHGNLQRNSNIESKDGIKEVIDTDANCLLANENLLSSISEVSICSEFDVDTENDFPLRNEIGQLYHSTPVKTSLLCNRGGGTIIDCCDFRVEEIVDNVPQIFDRPYSVIRKNNIVVSNSIPNEAINSYSNIAVINVHSSLDSTDSGVTINSLNLNQSEKGIAMKHSEVALLQSNLEFAEQIGFFSQDDIALNTTVSEGIIGSRLHVNAENNLTMEKKSKTFSDSTSEKNHTNNNSEENSSGNNSSDSSAHSNVDDSETKDYSTSSNFSGSVRYSKVDASKSKENTFGNKSSKVLAHLKVDISETGNFSVNNSVESSSHSKIGVSETDNSSENYSFDSSVHSKGVDVSKTAWGQWLLQKEKRRRNELLSKFEKNGKKFQAEKIKAESKALEKQKADEIFQKWLCAKNKEIANKKRLESLSMIRKEKDAQIAKEKSHALIYSHLKEWKAKKDNERLHKEKAELEAKTKALKEAEDRGQRNERAYKQWLQQHCKPRRNLYSYGYNSGTIICYYDATSLPPPTFCNPRPWISPT